MVPPFSCDEHLMNPDFKKNHFALFGIKEEFSVDLAALDTAYLEVQREVHPDRFANRSDAEKRVAAQWATQANEAYRTLKSPLARGRYLLRLANIDTEEESNTAMPIAFLMQQMAWREAVVDAKAQRDEVALDLLARQKRDEESALFNLLAEQLSTPAAMPTARETVRKLRFLEKLGEEIDLASEALDR